MLVAQTRADELPAETSFATPSPNLKFPYGTEPFLKAVAARLAAQVEQFEPEIAAMTRYALTVQGKQLRPMLVALSAEASGGLKDDHVTVATIIEMVHLATLVHDDVIDEAEIRRGKPTVAANWGNEISILVGDCLFAHSLKLASNFPTTEICRSVSSATNTVCTGEILQTQQRHNYQLSRADYFRVLAMKTGELFGLSCDLGAYLAQAPAAHRSTLRQFGMSLGTAYQIYDDCIDVFGSELAAGKSLGTDLASGKVTLPLLVYLERAGESERAELNELLRDWTPAYLPRVVELFERYDVLAESCAVLSGYLSVARASLSILPLTAGRVALTDLTEYLGRQTSALEVSQDKKDERGIC